MEIVKASNGSRRTSLTKLKQTADPNGRPRADFNTDSEEANSGECFMLSSAAGQVSENVDL